MSKKSDAIFEATAKVIRNDIYLGRQYDSLSHVIYKNGDAPVQRTVNDMMARWERLAASIERDIAWLERNPTYVDGEFRCHERLERDVEMARRLYLTIQQEQKRLDAEKAYWAGEIDFSEYLRRCM